MLFEMTQSAHRLGMALAAEAERADEIGRKIEYLKLFDRCFFAVRVGIALELRLKREGRADAARADAWDDPADRAERDPSEEERPERPERPERLRLDADRDREVERATLPLLLDTLQGVAADAQALPGPPPAELPTLRDLLARYANTAEPSAPAPAQTRRARLASSTAALAGQGVFASLLTRPATGPPPTRSCPRAKPG
jgi:hypothetical protein